MLLIHANYLDENFQLVQGDLEIQEGKILRVGKDLPRKEEDLAVDCGGEYTIVPGFVDVHIHGCAGADACDGTRESLETMARFLLEHGVTFKELGILLGITGRAVSGCLRQDRMPVRHHRVLCCQAGIPADLLPRAEDVPTGPKPREH